MRRVSLCLTTLILLALPSITFAQGRLSGRVADEAGEPLADVEAKLVDTETGAEVVKLSSRKGRFNLAVVHADHPYEIHLSKDGYVPIREEIRLQRGEPVQGSWIMVVDPDRQALLDLSPEELAAKQAAVDLYNEGAEAVRTGDMETAAAKFDAAIAEDPELVEAYPIGAATSLEIGSYDRALELAEVALTNEADNARALGIRYDALNALGREEEADAALDRLIATVPEGDTARRTYNRGLAHARKGEIDSAVARVEQALVLEPTLAQGWGLLGDLEMGRGAHQRVFEIADRLLEIEGSRERGLSLRHRAFEAMGDKEGATEALRGLAEIDPDAVMNSLFQQGTDLFNNDDSEAAIAIFRQVLDLQPDNAQAHFELGRSLLSAGDTAAARTHLQRFLELAPDDPQAGLARDMLSYLE